MAAGIHNALTGVEGVSTRGFGHGLPGAGGGPGSTPFASCLDEVVPVDHARRIFETAKHPKSYISLDDAGHLLTRAADARYAATVIAAWAARYITESG